MVYSFLALLLSLLLDILTVTFKTESDKDLEILVLRHQLRLLQRKVDKFRKGVKGVRSRLNEGLLLFKPDTILKWHHELVKRRPGAGRP
jgi:putative transposase